MYLFIHWRKLTEEIMAASIKIIQYTTNVSVLLRYIKIILLSYDRKNYTIYDICVIDRNCIMIIICANIIRFTMAMYISTV